MVAAVSDMGAAPGPRARIVGVGGYLPKRIVTNDELALTVDTSDHWIRERTGIRQRYRASADETAAFMGAAAARAALADAGAESGEIDLVVLATATPDNAFPATATQVQALIGADRAFAFDVSAACSGFLYALSIADSFIRTGAVRSALVIGSEVYSRIVDWSDRATCVLFGDGAGAVLLRASENRSGAGILSTHLHSDGRLGDLLYVDGAVGRPELTQHLVMHGREVFRHAVGKLAGAVDEALAANGLAADAVDWLVPHQANLRIIDAMGRKLGLRPDRIVVTIDRHANTSAASIPLALAEAVKDGRIRSGDLVVLEALGGGMTWASALVRM